MISTLNQLCRKQRASYRQPIYSHINNSGVRQVPLFSCQLKWRFATQLVRGMNIPAPAGQGYRHTHSSWSGVLSWPFQLARDIPIPVARHITTLFPKAPLNVEVLHLKCQGPPIGRHHMGPGAEGCNPLNPHGALAGVLTRLWILRVKGLAHPLTRIASINSTHTARYCYYCFVSWALLRSTALTPNLIPHMDISQNSKRPGLARVQSGKPSTVFIPLLLTAVPMAPVHHNPKN